jgi:hypothetical protein
VGRLIDKISYPTRTPPSRGVDAPLLTTFRLVKILLMATEGNRFVRESCSLFFPFGHNIYEFNCASNPTTAGSRSSLCTHGGRFGVPRPRTCKNAPVLQRYVGRVYSAASPCPLRNFLGYCLMFPLEESCVSDNIGSCFFLCIGHYSRTCQEPNPPNRSGRETKSTEISAQSPLLSDRVR